MNLVVFAGLPGVGKSTVADALARSRAWPVFSVDPVESALHEAGYPSGFERGLAAYLVAKRLAAEHLRLGMSVVIDACNGVEPARVMWRELARAFEARLTFVECTCEPAEHRRRLEARHRNLPGFGRVRWADVEERLRTNDPWHDARVTVDTGRPVEESVDAILRALDSRGKT